MSVKVKEIGLNQFLTTIYGKEIDLSLILMKLGLNDEQIKTLYHDHLTRLVDGCIGLLRQRMANVRVNGERLYRIISRRFELDGEKRATLQALGDELGISREQVRKLEQVAIWSCKANATKQFLEDGLIEIVASLLADRQLLEVKKPLEFEHALKAAVKDKAEQNSRLRQAWSEDELSLLLQKCSEGLTSSELAAALGRSKQSIELRLKKDGHLRAAKAYVEKNWSYTWDRVCGAPDQPYLFPEPITDFMLENYDRAVIYRWVGYGHDKELSLYIGSTDRLCPNRLKYYLQYEPNAGSRRLQSTFSRYRDSGWQIGLEILSFQPIVMMPNDLSTGYVRHFLEKMLINYYSQLGQPLQNRNSDKA